MQEASLGIALAHGAGVTTAGADAVLYGGDLRVVPWAVALARQVRGSIRSNLIFAAAYNAIGMALAATGFLHPVAAALLMVVSSFTVSWRALRSAECADDCCAAIPAAPPKLETVLDNGSAVRRRFQIASGIAIIAQAPFLVYLGQLSGMASALTWAVLLGLGIFIVRFRPRDPGRARVAHMILAMLGPGNWGMILGWWADAGFSPVGAVCHHCAAQGFSLWSFAAMPWMNLGMLLFGLPPMFAESTRPRLGWAVFRWPSVRPGHDLGDELRQFRLHEMAWADGGRKFFGFLRRHDRRHVAWHVPGLRVWAVARPGAGTIVFPIVNRKSQIVNPQ